MVVLLLEFNLEMLNIFKNNIILYFCFVLFDIINSPEKNHSSLKLSLIKETTKSVKTKKDFENIERDYEWHFITFQAFQEPNIYKNIFECV